jgi:bifunctional non-homologous end joining protein LigD
LPHRITLPTFVLVHLKVDGREVEVKNLDKIFYPEVGFTKGEVLDYYIRIAPVLLPHLRGRPLTLKRYPDGVTGPHFYEKRCPQYRPAWVGTVPIWSDRHDQMVDYCVIDDLATLVWAVNLADLEMHVSLSTRELERPTCMVFDLDPGAPAGLIECARVALRVRRLLEALGLESYPKTSGGKGLQVYAPLNTPVTYDETKPLAKAIAEKLQAETPGEVVSQMTKALRPGKVFIDWSQNDSYKTTVCVYSLRAKERPRVSTPLEWKEVEAALKANAPERLVFEASDVLDRVRRRGDSFARVLEQKQVLPSAETLRERQKALAAGSRGRSRGDRAAHRPVVAEDRHHRATTGRRRRASAPKSSRRGPPRGR